MAEHYLPYILPKDKVEKLKPFLEKCVQQFNDLTFIENDPISIPHQFSQQQDIEIAGFFAAIFAWGQRKTIINKCRLLLQYMDNAPFDFVENFKPCDFKPMMSFKHRTFNATDLFYTLRFLKNHYQKNDSLEQAFVSDIHHKSTGMETLLTRFHHYFFHLENAPDRTRKHIATPARNSACKRLNMFLRWMVRQDDVGVDFGLWQNIQPPQLICPLDVHSGQSARRLGLLKRKQNDWKAAVELTENLKCFNIEDPVIYDFALFGLGIMKKGWTA